MSARTDERPRCRARGAPCHPAALLILLVPALCAPSGAGAAGGHLRVVSREPGALHLRHAQGWERTVGVDAGEALLWDLPSGEYTASFTPAALTDTGLPGTPETVAPAEISVSVWEDLTSRVEIGAAGAAPAQPLAPDDGRGAVLLLHSYLLQALPGDKEAILSGLDTHTRWRPGVRAAGLDARVAAERREIIPGTLDDLGPTWLSISPAPVAGQMTRWDLGSGFAAAGGSTAVDAGAAPGALPAWVHVRGTAQRSSYAGTDFTAQAMLSRLPFDLLSGRGYLSIRRSSLDDAAPRAKAGGVLPHNDAEELDLSAELQLGPAAAGSIAGSGCATGASAGAGSAATPGPGRWSGTLQVASRGWRRNHFLEVYRRNPKHAPYQESGLFLAQAGLALRVDERTRGELLAGYDRYLTRLGDGHLKGNLTAYAQAEGNGGVDASGLYWTAGDGPEFGPAHVFDYYQQKFTETYRAVLRVTRAVHDGEWLLRGFCDARLHAYRRFEHFSPSEFWGFANALGIGYDETGAHRSDALHGPRRALLLRAGAAVKGGTHGSLRWDAALGGMLFAARDSALASREDPLGPNARLDREELRATPSCLRPEGLVGLRWRDTARGDAWITAYRQAHLPPLEALYSPRAFLALLAPEGVMGNPALGPELETGGEIGLAREVRLAGRSVRLTGAGYAARLDDAVSLRYARVPAGIVDGDTLLATYASEGTLRRWGLHLDASLGDARRGAWVRLSYDLARIESRGEECALLDLPWIYPDEPQGEYASEGYASALGGILDGVADGGAATARYRPSDLDRTHRLSLALIWRDPPPAADSGWRRALTRGWTLGAMARLETGRPYTQVYVYAAGIPPQAVQERRGMDSDEAWEQPVSGQARNAQRMPGSFYLDLALTRRLPLGSRRLAVRLEALNVLAIANAESVFRATGKADDDGCLDSSSCSGGALPAGTGATAYRERLQDPRHYGRPLVLRAALALDLI